MQNGESITSIGTNKDIFSVWTKNDLEKNLAFFQIELK